LSTTNLLGVKMRIVPETADERAWYETGWALTQEQAIRAARDDLDRDSAP
jgi:hypothetical protein